MSDVRVSSNVDVDVSYENEKEKQVLTKVVYMVGGCAEGLW